MRIVVTGGLGFVGSHLVEELLNQEHEVFVFDDFSTGSFENIPKEKLRNPKLEVRSCDLSETPSILYELGERKIDAVVHLAALARIQLSLEKPLETLKANVNGTLNALFIAKALGASKFLFSSSSSVYGDQQTLPLTEDLEPHPLSPYPLHKHMSEQLCELYSKLYDLPCVSMRFFNVYGTRMNVRGAYKLVFGHWLDQIKRGEPITIEGDGEQTRDFTYVGDVVRAIMKLLYKDIPKGNTILNVCSGKETSLNRLAELFGYPSVHVDARKVGDERRKCGSYKKFEDLFGWVPQVDIEEGIRRMKAYYEI